MMGYEQFFGLKENPFRQSADTDFYYPSPKHSEALHHLLYCIYSEEGFALITGDPGTGKTLLIRIVLKQVDERVKAACISDSSIGPKDLLTMVFQDLGMTISKDEDKTNEELLREFKYHLIDLMSKGFIPVIIIDEAQHLDFETLEQLRLLSNLETEKKKLVKIILVGQRELEQKLKTPELKQILQRITLFYKLDSLPKEEIIPYVNHRLKIAQSDNSLHFSPSIIRYIYYHSYGFPRLVNVLCERAMMSAFYEGNNHILKRHVKDAVSSMKMLRKRTTYRQLTNIAIMLSGIVLNIIIFFGAYLYMTNGFQSLPFPLTDLFYQQNKVQPTQELHLSSKEESEKPLEIKTETNSETNAEAEKKAEANQPGIQTNIPQTTSYESITPGQEKQKTIAPAQEKQKKSDEQDTAQSIGQKTGISINGDVSENVEQLNEPRKPENNMPLQFTDINSNPLQINRLQQPLQNQSISTQQTMMSQNTIINTDSNVLTPVTEDNSQPKQSNESTSLTPQKIPDIDITISPDVVTHFSEGTTFLTIYPFLNKGIVFDCHQDRIQSNETLSINWPFQSGVFFLGKPKHGAPFIFHPTLTQNNRHMGLSLYLWESVAPFLSSSLMAIVVPNTKTISPSEIDQAASITAMIYSWTDAWQAKNIDQFMSVYHKDQFIIYKPYAASVIMQFQDVKNQMQTLFSKTDLIQIEWSKPLCILDPINSKHAVAMFYLRSQYDQQIEEGMTVLFLSFDMQSKVWKLYARFWMTI